VAELEADDFDGMSEGQIADYEGELARGGGDNWTELVESATCATCRVTLIRRTLGGVETVQSFDSEPALRGKPALVTRVTKRPPAAKAKPVAKPAAKKRTAAKKARPGAGVKRTAAPKKAKASKAKAKPRPKAKPTKAKTTARKGGRK
jgi:hypothetical protein